MWRGAFILSLGLLLLVCACRNVNPAPPEPTLLDSTLMPPPSHLVLPVNYEVAELNHLLNAKISGTFVKAWLRLGKQDDSVYLEVTRSALIRTQWRMPYLDIWVPVHIKGIVSAHRGNMHLQNKKPIEGEVMVHLQSAIGFQPSWQLAPKTRLKGIRWVKDPKAQVWIFTIDLKNRINKIIWEREPQLTRRFDQVVSEKLNFRKAIVKLWHDIQKPVRVNQKEVNVFLQNRCESISAAWIDKGPGIISLQLKCLTRPQIAVACDTTNYSFNKVLPPFRWHTPVPHNQLNLYFFTRVSYKTVNEELNRRLKGYTLKYEGYHMRIKEVEVYGVDDTAQKHHDLVCALAVKLKVGGSVRGDLYMRGRLYYDSTENAIGISHFAFDINTQNSLVQAADWVFHSQLLQLVHDKLKMPLDSQVARLPNLMVAGIERSKVGEKIDVEFERFNARPVDLLTTRDDIQVVIGVQTKASILLQRKIFMKNKRKLRVYKPRTKVS